MIELMFSFNDIYTSETDGGLECLGCGSKYFQNGCRVTLKYCASCTDVGCD